MSQQVRGYKELEYSRSIKNLDQISSQILVEVNRLMEEIDKLIGEKYHIGEEIDFNYKETFLNILNVKEYCITVLEGQIIDKQLLIDLVSSILELMSKLYEQVHRFIEHLPTSNLPIELMVEVEVKLIQVSHLVKDIV
ncbi:hypothetical protein [Bacillus sp. AK128]